ncbi:hypothetical protein J4E82_010733 [Alternaria postmessia]|uniref:Uncharacterized protein n=1 Tax=Alternaria tenuissima TaxID=119927 RepID=A0AB37WWG5_9PLEO|nr:uncharacterized protein J4E82_010733 [Alternaria postmessia]KAI5368476.1 hypothetical protein J4E82_010733 [Alternaria postmessia]RYN37108.1 hypothetical protein AA0115_g1338 [Alternaria tenuissima]
MSGQGNAQSWTEHEVLVYLLSVIEAGNVQLDYNNAPVPAGRNVNGCRQKINKTKLALKPEIDALKAGSPIAAAVTTPAGGTPTKKAATPLKRKPKTDDEGNTGEVTPKKGRGRPKKNKEPTPEAEEDQEDLGIKSEFGEDEVDDILKEAELI